MRFNGTLRANGEKIRGERLSYGMSLRQMARKADRSLGLICKAENGGDVRAECLQDIADVLHVPMQDLVARGTPESDAGQSRERNVQVVLQLINWIDEWTTGRTTTLIDELSRFTHEDATWRYSTTFPTPMQLEHCGIDEIRNTLQRFCGAFDRAYWDLRLVRALDSNQVFVELIDYTQLSDDGMFEVTETRYHFKFGSDGRLISVDETSWLAGRIAELPRDRQRD